MQLLNRDSVIVKLAVPEEVVIGNIRRNRDRDIPKIHDLPEWRELLPCAIAGGGPSLLENVDSLRRFKYIMACGSAHDWLVHNGVAPKWTVVVDPDPVMARYLTSPLKGCTYLVASQCHDAVFDALKGFDVVLWHAGDDAVSRDIWGKDKNIVIGGGCTVGTRAIIIALGFGYTNLHLFGFDSCMPDENMHHAYGFATDEEKVEGVTRVRLGSETGKEFLVAGYHIGQMLDFKEILRTQANRMRVTVHGGGAIAELMRLEHEAALAVKDRAN